MCRKGFLCECVEFSGVHIVLNGGVEPIGVKHLEPCTETCQLPKVQLLDGFFDVFGGHHISNIASARRREKVPGNAGRTPGLDPPAHREQRAGDGARSIAH
jgi:hypothetical protein